MRFSGYDVATEFYVNDAGKQVENLARSVWARYLEARGRSVPFPEDGYHGEYVRDLASALAERDGGRWEALSEPPDLTPIAELAVERMRDSMRRTLDRFGVRFDCWVSERSLHDSGAVAACLDELRRSGHLYEQEGAEWLRSSALAADERDRVVRKSDGQPTYIAPDIAYHRGKLARGFGRLIDIWGADHHGHIPGIRAGLVGLGADPDSLEVLLVQTVRLLRGGVEVKMSKRSGEFVTLREVLDEVGADATRYFFLSRRHDASIDFDLELAKRRSLDNPVFYVQYAHARCAAIARRARELDAPAPRHDDEVVARLTLPEEMAVLRKLAEFPVLVTEAARALEPHRIVFFAHDLAQEFQSYYTRLQKVHGDTILPQARHRVGNWRAGWDWERTTARLVWVAAIQQVLANALALVGISAPQRMERPAEAEGESSAEE
jgi:arginyl-tRNA synthetase